MRARPLILLLVGGSQTLGRAQTLPIPEDVAVPEDITAQDVYESGIIPILLTPVVFDSGLPEIKHEVDQSIGVVQSKLESIKDTVQALPVLSEVESNYPAASEEEALRNAVDYLEIATDTSEDILTDAYAIANEANVLLSDLSDVFAAYGDEKAAPIEEKGDDVMALRAELIDTLVTTPLDNATNAFASQLDQIEDVATTPMVGPAVMTAATQPIAAILERLANATYIGEYFPQFFAWLEPILAFLSSLSAIVGSMAADLEAVLRKYWSDLNAEIMSSWTVMYVQLWSRAAANFDPMVALNDWLYSRGAAAAAPLDAVATALDDAVELNQADDYIALALDAVEIMDDYVELLDEEVELFLENPELYVANLLLA